MEDRDLANTFPEACPDAEGKLQRMRIWPPTGSEETAENYAQSYEGTHLGRAKNLNMINSGSESMLDECIFEHEKAKTRFGSMTSQRPEIQPTPESALSNVLLTTELMESILAKLSPLNLYLSRQVCYTWRNLIDTSPTLQTRMLRTSALPQKPGYGNPYNSPQFILNPILIHLNLLSHPTAPAACSRCGSGSQNCNRHVSSFDHMFKIAQCHFPPRWRIEKGADWREVQLFDPPIQQVFLRSSWLEKYVIGNEGVGVTAGQIADLLEFQTGALFLRHSV